MKTLIDMFVGLFWIYRSRPYLLHCIRGDVRPFQRAPDKVLVCIHTFISNPPGSCNPEDWKRVAAEVKVEIELRKLAGKWKGGPPNA